MGTLRPKYLLYGYMEPLGNRGVVVLHASRARVRGLQCGPPAAHGRIYRFTAADGQNPA